MLTGDIRVCTIDALLAQALSNVEQGDLDQPPEHEIAVAATVLVRLDQGIGDMVQGCIGCVAH